MSFVNAPIHDLLIRIKNAYLARKEEVRWVPFSNFKISILNLLKDHQFIKDYVVETVNNKKFITVHLKEVINSNNDIPVIKFYSKPSRRRYVSYKDIKFSWWQKGIGIISTSQWVLTTRVAKTKKLGWEWIADIY
jgi:small subunit ribosomal protein S8